MYLLLGYGFVLCHARRMEIDWSKAPRNARWWAMDANGQANWYCAPDVKPFTDFWFHDSKPAPTFGFSVADWKTSLVERPVEKRRKHG
ncbi:hypothetical protein OPIT5_08185 [Opitutaceae bacterium TAV5]|nr:hypothetical protein OPIT5_08185 [Opitutaceae bacterium TAV5]